MDSRIADKMEKIAIFLGFFILLVLIGLANATDQASEGLKIVVVEIDCTSQEDIETLPILLNEFENFGYRVSVFITPRLAEQNEGIIREIIKKGHSIGVLGEGDLSSMSLDEQIEYLSQAFYTLRKITDTPEKVVDFNSRYAIRLDGVWQNEKHVMGGPFRSYGFYDENDGRLYMIDLAVYAPGERKYQYIRQLDGIASTFETNAEIERSQE